MSLRCGRIAYTNALPVYAAFDAGAIPHPGTLHAGVPSQLNARLLTGELDVSPVSAFAWAAHADDLVLLPDLCIGARADVVSVLLVSPVAPALLDGKRIYATRDSASGLHFLRVLLERRYGVRPSYEPCDDALQRARAGEPALVIGDAAIDARETVPPEWRYDLGRLWREWTGRHSVFAVWAARRDVAERRAEDIAAYLEVLTDACSWSRAHSEDVVARAQSAVARSPQFYRDYYGKLNYSLHAAARAGLAAYCRELAAIGAIARVPDAQAEQRNAVAG